MPLQSTFVKTIESMAPKAIVYRFEGRATKVLDRKSGTNSNGDWSIQNAWLEDPQGDKIKVAFFGHPPVPFQAGDWVAIEAHKSDKGWSSLYVEDDEYQGTRTRILRATGSAKIGVIDPPGGHANQAPDYDTRHQDPGNKPSGEPEPRTWDEASEMANRNAGGRQQAAASATSEMIEAKRTIVQIANLHLICALAVERQEAPTLERITGQPMSESQRQGATASIFIKAEREGLARKMPTRPLKPEDFA